MPSWLDLAVMLAFGLAILVFVGAAAGLRHRSEHLGGMALNLAGVPLWSLVAVPLLMLNAGVAWLRMLGSGLHMGETLQLVADSGQVLRGGVVVRTLAPAEAQALAVADLPMFSATGLLFAALGLAAWQMAARVDARSERQQAN